MVKADASWTIKSVPVATRLKAVNAARAQDQTMAEWLVDVIEAATSRQDQNEVIPPGKPDQISGKPPLSEDQRTARMLAVAAMMQGLAAVKTATGRASGRDVVMDAVWSLEPDRRRIAGRGNGRDIEGEPT
jgi:hypothetical protein